MDQKFRLLPALPVHVADFVTPIPLINHSPIHSRQVGRLVVPARERRDAVAVGKDELKAGLLHGLHGGFEIHQRFLPSV